MDRKALDILFDLYWGPKGWKNHGTSWDPFAPPPLPPAGDFAYAKQHGVMLDNRSLTRKETLAWCRRSVRNVKADAVADSFAESLASGGLDLRSALGSFAVGRRVPKHRCDVHDDTDGNCMICGLAEPGAEDLEDLNVLNFERHKWGGVRHTDPIYIALDLELFAKAKRPELSEAGREAMAEFLNAAESTPATAKPNDLERKLRGVFSGDKSERRTVIAILGLCGVLEPKKHPSVRRMWINAADTPEPPGWTDWEYPIAFWKGSDGVNAAAVREWFPWLSRRQGRWIAL